MKVNIWPSAKTRTLHSRRGSNVYRSVEVPARTNQIEYVGMSMSVLELMDGTTVLGTAEVTNNVRRPYKIEPCDGQQIETLAIVEEATGDGPETPDDDDVLKVGAGSSPDGGTISGSVSVQVSSVDEGDARLGSSDERGSEGGADGVHSDPPEPEPVHDRLEDGVSPVRPADEDAGRDGFQRYPV